MPLVHEAKCAGYLWLSSETYYVLAAGMAEPEEIPPEFGVLLAHGLQRDADPNAVRLAWARSALRRPMLETGRLPFGVWMALARATVLHWDGPPTCRPPEGLGPGEPGRWAGR